VTLKLVGRVGDTPIPGAGNYASEHVAASATGTGEYVMRLLSTRVVSERVARGEPLDEAVRAVLEQMGHAFDADVGIIAVDREGRAVAQHRTRDMPHAWFSGDAPVTARARA
jgi:beta-aspartyl-peptidase (threonine type)